MSQCNNTNMNGKNEHGEENNLVEGVFYPAADYWHDLLSFEGYRRELEIDINTGKERSILHPTLPNREIIYGKEGESLPDLMCRTLRHAGLAFDRAGTNFDGDFTLDSLYDLGLELLANEGPCKDFDKCASKEDIYMSQCNTNNIRISEELVNRIKQDAENLFGDGSMWLKGFIEHPEILGFSTLKHACEKRINPLTQHFLLTVPGYCNRRLYNMRMPSYGLRSKVIYYDDLFPYLDTCHKIAVNENITGNVLKDFGTMVPKYMAIKRPSNNLPEDFKVSLKKSDRHYDIYNIKDTIALQKLNRRRFPHDTV